MNMEGWKTFSYTIANLLFWGANALGLQIDGTEELIPQTSAAIFTLISVGFLILRHYTVGKPGWRK